MKHISNIELLYQKYIKNTLTDIDLEDYKKLFDRQEVFRKETRFDDAKFVSLFKTENLHESEFENTASLSDIVQTIIIEHNLLLDISTSIILPLVYITLDGNFITRFKKLLNTTFCDTKNSYFMKFERSDLFLSIKIFYTEDFPISGCNLEFMSKQIKSGCLLAPNEVNDFVTRLNFWNYLNLYDFQIMWSGINHLNIPKLPEWLYYEDYLEKKKGYYPESTESGELTLHNNNKWFHLLLMKLFNEQEKFYIGEDFEDVRNFYIKLGFTKVRNYLGFGLFDFTDKYDLLDEILNKNCWKYLKLVKYYKGLYSSLWNMHNLCTHFYDYLIEDLLGVINKKNVKNLGIEGIIVRVVLLNLILDVTMDFRPKYRHPVTYDFFTTVRVIPTERYPTKNVFVEPILNLTEDDYHNYKKFFVEKSNEQMLRNLQDPIYLADKSGDYDKAQKLIFQECKEIKEKLKKKHLSEHVINNDRSKTHGIRKNLKLKPNESFR